MFTGIIEQIGSVEEYKALDNSKTGGNGASLTIKNASTILKDCHLGDSIAINGTCLTVTEFDTDVFKVGVSDETLRRTTLGSLKSGDMVNLERAISGNVRFGGHLVQGHIDTIAEIIDRHPDGNSISFTFQLRDREFINYIVHKGFIAVDGTSLTVTGVNYSDATFSIMMIAYTQSKVIMPLKKVGENVNIEVDLTGKLISRQVELQLGGQISNENSPLYQLVSRIVDQKISSLNKND